MNFPSVALKSHFPSLSRTKYFYSSISDQQSCFELKKTLFYLPTWNILLIFSVNTNRIDTISSQKTIILRHKIFIYSYLPSESWDARSYFPHKMILTFPYRLDIFLQISYFNILCSYCWKICLGKFAFFPVPSSGTGFQKRGSKPGRESGSRGRRLLSLGGGRDYLAETTQDARTLQRLQGAPY